MHFSFIGTVAGLKESYSLGSHSLTHFYTSHSYQLSSPNLLNNIIYSWYLITFFFLLSAAALHLGLEKQGSAASKGIILLSSVSGAAFLSGNRYISSICSSSGTNSSSRNSYSSSLLSFQRA